jgi:hypothetical protein
MADKIVLLLVVVVQTVFKYFHLSTANPGAEECQAVPANAKPSVDAKPDGENNSAKIDPFFYFILKSIK